MNRQQKIEYLALLEERDRRINLRRSEGTVVAIVDPKLGHTHSVVRRNGEWRETTEPPAVYLPAKLESVLMSKKRFIVVIGGRGSGKSVGVADVCLIDAKDAGYKTYCLREFQSSIKNSILSLLCEEIGRLGFQGFTQQAASIKYGPVDAFQFAGLSRNVDSIKSAHGFKRYQIEEAQFISSESLTALTPTARKKPNKGLPTDVEEVTDADNVSMVFIANPSSSEAPFSQRFIVPFKDALDRDGIYEDDLHLIVMMNYVDNPWFHESGLEQERIWDYQNRSRAHYDHIWLGAFNDSVENALIMSEWFDACVDAHKKLGFEGIGAKIAAHDPSDLGPDSKGYAQRHGSVVTHVEENTEGNVNEGGRWATDLAISLGCDMFTWDADGMGVALNEQISMAFDGKVSQIAMFKGSEGVDNPDAIYQPSQQAPVAHQRTNKQTFRNKRAQYYFELRDRCYRTYRAVVHGEYCDPARMISFDSTMSKLTKLRAELCRIPIKPNGNGMLELYTKDEMKTKFRMSSPNLADSVMMLMRVQFIQRVAPVIPRPIRPMGRK